MSTNTAVPTSLQFPAVRSAGVKFFLIAFLALVMSVSGFFVEGLTVERATQRGVLAASSENATEQPKTVLGIRLADSYRSTRRSLHYITLFLGLVFLTYFLFEVKTGRSVHPAQYALVGIAQTVFYLLLLSLAEHLGFDLSFAVLYAFIYVLLRVEAYALLVGAITSFVAVAAAMYMTRNVDWYGSTKAAPPAYPAPSIFAAAGTGTRESWLK